MAVEIISKRCSHCKQIKPITDFPRNRTTKDGYRDQCKVCHNIDNRTYRESGKNKVALRKYYKTKKGHLKYVFDNMLKRCNNIKCPTYRYYGGRGIKVKFTSFEDFFDYVVNDLKADPRGLTIDRIDNDGDYERGNIRFVTQAENNRNKRFG